MQIIKFVVSSLAAASTATASPVAQDRNQTLASAIRQGSNSNNSNKTHFQLFGRSFTAPFSNSTYMQQHGVDQTESGLAEQKTHRWQAKEDGNWGRPGKVPYRKFPKCYSDCFDSKGVTSKTSMFVGDIRDLTTHEFCHSQQGWVGEWMLDHLDDCVRGACAYCHPRCDRESGRVYEHICGHKWCENCQA